MLPPSARLFLGGRWACSAGDWLGATALGWLLVNELRGGSLAFAVNRVLIVVGMLACAPGVGAMLKRTSAAAVLVVSCIMAASLSFTTAGVAFSASGVESSTSTALLWFVVSLGVIGGISHSMRDGGEQRIQMLLVPEGLQHRLEQTWAIMYYIGRIVFAMISAYFLAKLGVAMLFVLDGASYLILGCVTLMVWKQLKVCELEKRNGRQEIEAPVFKGFWSAVGYGFRHYSLAFREVRKVPGMLLLLWLMVIVEGFGFTAWTLMPEIVKVEQGGTGFSYGCVIAIGGVGGLIGALLFLWAGGCAPRLWPKMFVASLFIAPAGLIGVGFARTTLELGIGYGVALWGWSWFLPSLRVFFRLGEHGTLTASMLSFTMYGVCRLTQVLLVVIFQYGAGMSPSAVLRTSASISLVCMLLTVVFARAKLAATLREMFRS